ncbi:hypothetical protein SAMN04487947_2899 [Halogeometricum rufum]|uniref:Photosynthesis system II assembly factor Ycf48/Hcf136-like domain-containing protein n=1 Tax=Halogeometricum rufum TaxID=553469 RepID=A0A1I6I5F8_9EURY|nr:hypothetical protein [Halogeometricum rufum]SFR61952.1 hypothetical protein SAMN04487947_2899 [Halogeometricum rufum]
MTRHRNDDGFLAFFRQYAQTWVHTVSTAALTAFGLLTFVNRLFAVVAIAAYVLPPVVQYVRRPTGEAAEIDDADETSEPAEPTAERQTEASVESGGADEEGTEAVTGDDADGDGEAGSDTGNTAADDDDEADSDDADGGDGTEPAWTAATVPTDGTLLDAAITADGAYAVGEGGVVVARDSDGDEWDALLSDGPGAGSNDLRGVDGVDGGGVWVAGDGGAVGRIDPDTGRHTDHSAPDGDTSAISGVAATDDGGAETVLLTDGSGRVRRGRYRDGELSWADPTKPGSGSSIAGVELDEDVGHVCDTGGGAFRTSDAGRTFESLGFEADGTAADVTSREAGDVRTVLVATDDGAVHRYDGSAWTPASVAEGPLLAVAAGDSGDVAAGEAATYERFDSSAWSRAELPAVESIRGVAVRGSGAVAVGDGGAVVERTA